MPSLLHTTLINTLSQHFRLSNHRLLTLVVLIIGFANSRTVNLTHTASQFPGAAQIASSYRRLQRFFQYIRLDEGVLARLAKDMLAVEGKHCLALDRTNWKIGQRDVNILMLALVTARIRIPLMWCFVGHGGNSSLQQRIDLMERYIGLFGVASIDILLADREFMGAEWIGYLTDKSIPFAIRIKNERRLQLVNGTIITARQLVTRRRQSRANILRQELVLAGHGIAIKIVGKPIKGDFLVIATNLANPRQALNAYKRRWRIECLFGDAKTRGFNLEDTRITNPKKLSSLLCVLTLSLAWAYRCAGNRLKRKPIAKNTHKRKYKSIFRIGFDNLRNAIINNPQKATQMWPLKTKCKELSK